MRIWIIFINLGNMKNKCINFTLVHEKSKYLVNYLNVLFYEKMIHLQQRRYMKNREIYFMYPGYMRNPMFIRNHRIMWFFKSLIIREIDGSKLFTRLQKKSLNVLNFLNILRKIGSFSWSHVRDKSIKQLYVPGYLRNCIILSFLKRLNLQENESSLWSRVYDKSLTQLYVPGCMSNLLIHLCNEKSLNLVIFVNVFWDIESSSLSPIHGISINHVYIPEVTWEIVKSFQI